MKNKQTRWLQILWVIAGIGFLVGLYGLVDRFSNGHMNTAYGSYVPWGLWVAAYTMLVGASAGAFALASVVYIFKKENWYPIAKNALLVSLAAFAGGMANVFLDLGHPERVFRLYLATNPSSIMGLMAWFYLLYGVLLVVMIFQAWSGKTDGFLQKLSFLAIPYAVLFAGAEGALFGVVGARPLWESGLTPLLFLIEGALSGVAIVALGNFVLGQLQDEHANILGKTLLALLIVLVLFEWAEFSTGLYAGIPSKTEALRVILFGPYWWTFWIFHLLLGVVVPALLLFFRPRNVGALTLASLLVAFMAIASKLNLVIPALTQEELSGLSAAYTGPGLTFAYFPTVTEWAVLVWTVSLAALIFLLGYQVVLPRFTKEVK